MVPAGPSSGPIPRASMERPKPACITMSSEAMPWVGKRVSILSSTTIAVITYIDLNSHRNDNLLSGVIHAIQRQEYQLHEEIEHSALEHDGRDIPSTRKGVGLHRPRHVPDASDDEQGAHHVGAEGEREAGESQRHNGWRGSGSMTAVNQVPDDSSADWARRGVSASTGRHSRYTHQDHQ